MRVTVHQPEHIPWLGFFHKLNMADTYVILDNVQFRKNYFQNRNKIRTSEGWIWITVPVSRTLDTRIMDVTIVPEPRWKKKWLDSVSFSYKKAPYFDLYYKEIELTVNREFEKLSDLNISLIRTLCKFFGIKTELLLASSISPKGTSSDLILDICRKVAAKQYISGVSGKEYLMLDQFKEEGIDVTFQDFHHPIYKQVYEPFMPCMSAADLLFNHGDKSLDILNGRGVEVMKEIFL